ncbi:MAG: hypothetical protein ACLGIK_10180 [Gemmatimonadota bacterium]
MHTHRIHVLERIVPNEFKAIRVTPNVHTTVTDVDAFTRTIETVASRGL